MQRVKTEPQGAIGSSPVPGWTHLTLPRGQPMADPGPLPMYRGKTDSFFFLSLLDRSLLGMVFERKPLKQTLSVPDWFSKAHKSFVTLILSPTVNTIVTVTAGMLIKTASE